LAEAVLASLTEDEVSRLKAFVEKGGRLVIAGDAFFEGTVPKANQIIADYGERTGSLFLCGCHLLRTYPI
jgi:uncharacterized membrane protein